MFGEFQPKSGGLHINVPGGKAIVQSGAVLGGVCAPGKDKAAWPEEGGDREISQAGVCVGHHGVPGALSHPFNMSVDPRWIHQNHIHLTLNLLFKLVHIAGDKGTLWW